MEKRRVRLEINGVICGLITQESDEYMKSLADEVSEMLEEIQIASPYITREAAALTVALNYCDDARKNGQKRKQLQERVDELEVEAEVWHEERADMVQNGPNPETLDPALNAAVDGGNTLITIEEPLLIIDENNEPVESLFEPFSQADSTSVLTPIPEYLDFLSFFQVLSHPSS